MLRPVYCDVQGIDGFDYLMTFKLAWLAYNYEGACRSLTAVVLWWRRRPGLQSLLTEFRELG